MRPRRSARPTSSSRSRAGNAPRLTAPFTRDATAPQLRPIDPALHPFITPDRDAEPTPLRPRRPRRARLAVVAAAPRRRSIGVLVAALCAVIFVGLLGLTAVQVTLAQNQQRLDQVNRDIQDARTYYDRLRLAVARLQSPDYIVPAATERLGMVPAVSPTYLTPTADIVTLVAASSGLTIADTASGTGAGRPEWGEVKEISGQAP